MNSEMAYLSVYSSSAGALIGNTCSTVNWNQQIYANQMKCWFFRGGEKQSTRRKTSWSRV